MKGAIILSKDESFFHSFVEAVLASGLPYDSAILTHIPGQNSITIAPGDKNYLRLDDNLGVWNFIDELEFPPSEEFRDYHYAFLADCRSETNFCDIIRCLSSYVDMVICDGDGIFYRPDELSPETVVL